MFGVVYQILSLLSTYPHESWPCVWSDCIRTTTIAAWLSGPQMIFGVIYKEKHSHPHLHIFS